MSLKPTTKNEIICKGKIAAYPVQKIVNDLEQSGKLWFIGPLGNTLVETFDPEKL